MQKQLWGTCVSSPETGEQGVWKPPSRVLLVPNQCHRRSGVLGPHWCDGREAREAGETSSQRPCLPLGQKCGPTFTLFSAGSEWIRPSGQKERRPGHQRAWERCAWGPRRSHTPPHCNELSSPLLGFCMGPSQADSEGSSGGPSREDKGFEKSWAPRGTFTVLGYLLSRLFKSILRWT